MRLIERLYQFIEYKQQSFYAFERECGMANGYLKKQFNGKGTVGSDTLEKIHRRHAELSLVWLITGKGHMLSENLPPPLQLPEANGGYTLSKDDIILTLREQIAILERTVAGKEKIILMLESRMRRLKSQQ